MPVHAQNYRLVLRSLFVQIIPLPLQHLIYLACPNLRACSGGESGRSGKTKDVRSEQFCEERKTMTNITMMLLWSDQDH